MINKITIVTFVITIIAFTKDDSLTPLIKSKVKRNIIINAGIFIIP